MSSPSLAGSFHTQLAQPPTCALRPVTPDNACLLRFTAAAGTELAGAYSSGTVKRPDYSPDRISSRTKGVYNPRAFIPHAASLGQGFPHCRSLSTAASRRSLGRVSVPVWVIVLSDHLPIVALVSRYPTNELIGRRPLPKRLAALLV